jgi:hypothetical protein
MENIISQSIDYTLDELKMLVNTTIDNIIIHKIKRYMYKIYRKELPGEIFRKYPKNPNHILYKFREFFASEKGGNYIIEVSNYGRIKINDNIAKQIEEKNGWFYIKITETVNYPVYRLVAETWCKCFFEDSTDNWQVHHLSNDGYDNTPNNLIWIKGNFHNKIRTPKKEQLKNKNDEPNEEIEKIIKKLNTEIL